MSDTPDTETDEDAEVEPDIDPEDEPEIRMEDAPDPQDVDAAEGGGSLMDFIGSGGVSQMLLRDQYQDPETGHTYSQADLIADVINVMRMDAKQMARVHGLEVEATKMTPEKAASLMEAVTTSGGLDIIEVFQDIEDKNDVTLAELLDDEQYEQYMEFKEQMLYSVDTS